jgi:hypothetical protein
MIGRKKLRDVQHDLAEVLSKLPSENPNAWLDREIRTAKDHPGRDSETLKLLKGALKRATKK